MNAAEYLAENPIPAFPTSKQRTVKKGKKVSSTELANPFYLAAKVRSIPVAINKARFSNGVLAVEQKMTEDEKSIAKNRKEILCLRGQRAAIRQEIQEIESAIARDPKNWVKYAQQNALDSASHQFAR
jgi:hypothetical protein